jgi:hypothetical protein
LPPPSLGLDGGVLVPPLELPLELEDDDSLEPLDGFALE